MSDEKLRTEDQHFAEAKYASGPKKNSLPEGEVARKWILKACNHIQDLPGVHVIAGDPEYNALASCISDDECKVVLKMKLMQHYTFDELQKKTKFEPEQLKGMLKHMAYVGLLSFDPTDPEVALGKDGKKQAGYWYTIFVPGILEAMVNNVENVEKHPIIAQAFSEYTIKRIIPLAGNLPNAHGVMRVVPIQSAI